MALIGNNGEYLKIENIVIDAEYVCSISYKIYMSVAHRQTGDTAFLHSISGTVNSGILQTKLNALADGSLTRIDNLKKIGYEAIKEDNFEISSWIDG